MDKFTSKNIKQGKNIDGNTEGCSKSNATVLVYWSMTSETHGGTVEVEPSQQ